MAIWYNSIDLVEEWGQLKSGEITTAQFCGIVATKLEAITKMVGIRNIERGNFAEDFRKLSEQEEVSNEEFDDLWGQLYDWGDSPYRNGKLCWISTF